MVTHWWFSSKARFFCLSEDANYFQEKGQSPILSLLLYWWVSMLVSTANIPAVMSPIPEAGVCHLLGETYRPTLRSLQFVYESTATYCNPKRCCSFQESHCNILQWHLAIDTLCVSDIVSVLRSEQVPTFKLAPTSCSWTKTLEHECKTSTSTAFLDFQRLNSIWFTFTP